MPNMINKLLVSEFEREFKDKGSFLILEFRGLKAQDAHELRGKMKEKGIRFRVVKNRLAKIAFERNGIGELGQALAGQCAVIYGEDEEAAIQAAKILQEAMKGVKPEQRPARIRGAYMDGETLPAEKAAYLHTLPDKATIRAQIVGAIQAPLRGLAAVLAAPGASIARALNARAEGEGS